MWNETTILERARTYASKYTDAGAELDTHYVRVAFEQFCIDSLCYPVQQSITTVADQREYTHRVVRVRRVVYDGQELPILPNPANTAQQYVVLYPSRLVLSFNPPANKQIVVDGYGIPDDINTFTLQPETQLMDAVAMLTAVKYLAVYADAQTQSRASVLFSQYQSVLQQFLNRHSDSTRAVDDNQWSETNILTRAREYARRYTERIDDLDLHYVRSAWQQFCIDTSAFRTEHIINTIGNQREYTHPLVRVSQVFLDNDELVILPEPNEYYRACAVYPNRIVLSFDPEPNQQIRIVGYGVPEIDTVYLEPATRLMDGIAMLTAYNYLIRFAEPTQIQSISLYQLEYRKIVDDFTARVVDVVRQRGGNLPVVGYVSFV